MADDRVKFVLRRAFREVTQNLIGLFELYDADPQLVQQAAAALQRVFQDHLKRGGPTAAPPATPHSTISCRNCRATVG